MAAVLHLNLVENFLKIIYGLSPSECSIRRSLGLESRGLGPGPAAALGCSSGPGTALGFSSGLTGAGFSSGTAGPGCSSGRRNRATSPGAGIIVVIHKICPSSSPNNQDLPLIAMEMLNFILSTFLELLQLLTSEQKSKAAFKLLQSGIYTAG